MPAVEQTDRRTFTDAEKREAVKRLKSKPKEQTVRELCEELGIGQPMLYTWRNRLANGEPLTRARGAKPGTALAKRDSRQLEIAGTSPKPVHVEIKAPAPLTMSEREELAVLRAEVKRYRKMLFASLEGP